MRAWRAILAVGLALALWSALATPAAAAVVHEQEGTFPLSGINLLAVDNSSGPSSGDLYIAELDFGTFGTRVFQADASGTPTGVELDATETPAGSFSLINLVTFKLAGSIAVDGSSGPSAGNIYVPDVANGVVDVFDETGKYVCQITGKAIPSASECAGASGSETTTGGLEPQSVAVDPTDGHIAVGDGSGVVYEFNAVGEFEGEIADEHIVEPFSIAFDSTGSLYVVNANAFTTGPGDAVKFDSSGAFEGVVATARFSVGVDLGNDHVYLGGNLEAGSEIEELDAAGAPISRFASEGAISIAVNAANSRVYLSTNGHGEIWSGDIFLPAVVTGGATGVEEGAATLHGHVDPEIPAGGSPVERCEFEYGEDEGYGQTAPCSPATPYSSAEDVEAVLAGLAPSTTYHYRLAAENADGKVARGEDRSFTTFGPAGISGEMAIARTRSATVKAQIDAFGFSTTCEVEYVSDATFQESGFAAAAIVPCAEDVPAGFGAHTVSAELTGLEIGTVYHFRFVARNEGGTSVGDDATFSTFGIASYSVEILDQKGAPFVQAGGHPYAMKVGFSLSTTGALSERNPQSVPANLRTVEVQLPPGLIGNPTATPRCPPAAVKPNECPGTTQIGFATVTAARGASEFGPVYNLVPPDGVAAQLGARFNAFGTARIDASIRSGSDYGVNADSLSITADEGVERVEMTVWGVPADEGHFSERFCQGEGLPGCASDAPLRPFLTNPTACLGPLQSVLRVDAWQDPGNFVSTGATLPGMTGCARLEFKPTLTVVPDTRAADSPTGLHVNLHVPQNQNPVGLAEANLKDAVVRLPAGMTINPAGAHGLVGCSLEQVELHGSGPARCPDAAKIGTAEVHTPLLDHPVKGGVFVAQQGNAGGARGANPFGSLLAIYIAVDDPRTGVVVKLAGRVAADPVSGQLTTTFSENPQLPFEDFDLDFFGGAGAALSTPVACGSFTTTSELTPWSAPEGADAHPSSVFAIDAGAAGRPCVGADAEQPNEPAFEAGTVTPLAGAKSPLILHLSRPDGSQRFSAIDVTLPRGLLGRLKGIPYCAESAIARARARSGPGGGSLEQADPSCPSASEVGSVKVGAGAGPTPLIVGGKAYLAGPYKGAPLSLVILTPAVAGPFDLGTVVVRTALFVNAETAQITAKSDPLPTILEGIPLDVRTVSLEMDRPNFILNPTSCDAMVVTGALASTVGQVAPLRDRFQVGGCKGLPFAPRLSLRVFGKTGRNAKPRLRAVLTAKPGEANIARAQVNLPHSEFLEQAHIRTVCTRVQFAAGQIPGEKCPRGSIYGKARAVTPLLDGRLEGPVFLRSSSHALPDLVASLNGQVNIVLVGRIDAGSNNGLRNTFELVPDAPVSKFVLEMRGGKNGLLVNSENLCAPSAQTRAIARFTGQNGKVRQLKPEVKNGCKKKRGRARPSPAHR